MVSQQLSDYVRQQAATGVTAEEIKKRLADSGWGEADINEAVGSGINKTPQAVTFPGADMSMPGKFDLGIGDTNKAMPDLPQLPQVKAGSGHENMVSGKKAKNSWLVWMGLAMVVLLVAGVIGFGLWQKMGSDQGVNQNQTVLTPEANPTTPAESKLSGNTNNGKYTDSTAGFAITAPEGWKTDNSGSFGTLVAFSNPQPDSEGNSQYGANMNVVVDEIGSKSLNDYVTSSKEQMTADFTNSILLSEGDVQIGTTPAKLLESTFDQTAFKLHNLQLILKSGTKAYIVTGASLDTKWEQYRQIFQDSLMSFELK